MPRNRVRMRTVRDWTVRQSARFDKGMALINKPVGIIKLSVYGGLFVEGWNRLGWFGKIPLEIVPYTVAVIVPLAWYLGFFDQEKLHFTQAENSYNTEHLNPHLRGISKDVKKLLKNNDKTRIKRKNKRRRKG